MFTNSYWLVKTHGIVCGLLHAYPQLVDLNYGTLHVHLSINLIYLRGDEFMKES